MFNYNRLYYAHAKGEKIIILRQRVPLVDRPGKKPVFTKACVGKNWPDTLGVLATGCPWVVFDDVFFASDLRFIKIV